MAEEEKAHAQHAAAEDWVVRSAPTDAPVPPKQYSIVLHSTPSSTVNNCISGDTIIFGCNSPDEGTHSLVSGLEHAVVRCPQATHASAWVGSVPEDPCPICLEQYGCAAGR